MTGPVLIGKSQIFPILSSILRLGLSTYKRTRRAVALRLALEFLVTVLDCFHGCLYLEFCFTHGGFGH
jgi:hypothetical protein